LQAVRNQELTDNFELTLGLVVPKVKIAANGDYNFSGERYREGAIASQVYLSYPLSEVCNIFNGSTPSKKEDRYWENGTIPWFTVEDIRKSGRIIEKTEKFVTKEALNETSLKLLPKQSVLLCCTASVGEYAFAEIELTTNQQFNGLVVNNEFADRLLPKFLFFVASRFKDELLRLSGKTSFDFVSVGTLKTIQIPLPPIAIQQEIVTEIEGYQKVINGARAVIDNYRPHIPIDSDWQIIKLGEICSFKNGLNFTKSESGYTVKIIGIANFQSNLYAPLDDLNTIHLDAPIADDYLVKKDDILFVRSNGNIDLVGRSIIVPPPQEPTTFSGFTIRGRIEDDRALPIFFAHFFKSRDFADMIKTVGRGANIRNLSQGILNELEIPLPPIEIQKAIVAEIEAEQTLVNANRELITRFEKKIQTTLNRIWGEE
jgi:type I restriction enzyme M protein